jgi:hypothetical protein
MTCPNCLAARDIKPKGDHVKFPWHWHPHDPYPQSGGTLGKARKHLETFQLISARVGWKKLELLLVFRFDELYQKTGGVLW